MRQERKILQVKLLSNMHGQNLSKVEAEMNQLLSEGWECANTFFDRGILFQKMVKYASNLKEKVIYVTNNNCNNDEEFSQKINKLLSEGWHKGEYRFDGAMHSQVMIKYEE